MLDDWEREVIKAGGTWENGHIFYGDVEIETKEEWEEMKIKIEEHRIYLDHGMNGRM
jgi:hypothetical protein